MIPFPVCCSRSLGVLWDSGGLFQSIARMEFAFMSFVGFFMRFVVCGLWSAISLQIADFGARFGIKS